MNEINLLKEAMNEVRLPENMMWWEVDGQKIFNTFNSSTRIGAAVTIILVKKYSVGAKSTFYKRIDHTIFFLSGRTKETILNWLYDYVNDFALDLLRNRAKEVSLDGGEFI